MFEKGPNSLWLDLNPQAQNASMARPRGKRASGRAETKPVGPHGHAPRFRAFAPPHSRKIFAVSATVMGSTPGASGSGCSMVGSE
jgi:hypothetical protein